MLLIWGFKRYVQTLAMLTLVCGQCGRPAAHPLRKITTKFTLFFIPLFPVRHRYAVQCAFCGASHELAKEEAERLQAQAAAAPAEQQYGAPQPAAAPQPYQAPPAG
jgi:hypothetical protein